MSLVSSFMWKFLYSSSSLFIKRQPLSKTFFLIYGPLSFRAFYLFNMLCCLAFRNWILAGSSSGLVIQGVSLNHISFLSWKLGLLEVYGSAFLSSILCCQICCSSYFFKIEPLSYEVFSFSFFTFSSTIASFNCVLSLLQWGFFLRPPSIVRLWLKDLSRIVVLKHGLGFTAREGGFRLTERKHFRFISWGNSSRVMLSGLSPYIKSRIYFFCSPVPS